MSTNSKVAAFRLGHVETSENVPAARDFFSRLADWIEALSGPSWNALLYRAYRGDNPYDFSVPPSQRAWVMVNRPQWF